MMADKTYVLLDDVIAYIASCERSNMLPVECSAITLIKNVPAADVRPVVRGKWMQKAEPVAGNYWVLWECSECGYVRTRGWAHTKDGRKPRAYFCERCSAEMMEG